MNIITGTPETQRFYDEQGWKEKDGAPIDRHLFGVKEDGPIRIELHRVHQERIRAALAQAGPRLNLLECGCGGTPERSLLAFCSRYTGVDFSDTGIQMARSSFADVKIPYHFEAADVCALPFADGAFDAVYSSHMIYHIEDPKAQAAAIAEFLRVVRPGGVVTIVAANPRTLLFPLYLFRRLAADTPLLGSLLNRLRSKPVLPYKPMSIGWVRRRLAPGGPVEVFSAGLPSYSFNQHVTEFGGTGKRLWKILRWLDVSHPKLSAYLGHYVMYSCQKRAQG
jgi:ubiquinone/menaquinone biosynthesis C-methylase UbiE